MAQNRTARRTARRIITVVVALAAFAGVGLQNQNSGAQAATLAITGNGVSTLESAGHRNPRTGSNLDATLNVANYDFATRISNIGEQQQIDECTGGLTKMVSVSQFLGRNYFPIHNECGGAPILDLADGNTVHIDGLGDFTVVATQDVMRGDSASEISKLPGEVLLQTCFDAGEGMRVVALTMAK